MIVVENYILVFPLILIVKVRGYIYFDGLRLGPGIFLYHTSSALIK